MARGRAARTYYLLDWVTVTYRSVFVTGLVVLVAVLGAYLYWNHFSRFGPRRAAEASLERAKALYAQAVEHREGGRFDELLGSARESLEEAQVSLDRRDYDEARIAALRSESLSQRVLDLARGEERARQRVRFYRIEGDVRVKRRGSFAWEDADLSMVLNVGDQVKTSSSASAQIVYFDGTVTTVRPGSLLEIRRLYENPATKVREVAEKLSWGELTASTPNRSVDGSFHEVATEGVKARAEGKGEFRVSADRQSGTTKVDVWEGQVLVAGGGKKEWVREGERIRADAQGRLRSRELLPGVPRLISPADEMIFIHENPETSSIRLSWEAVPGASRYRLLISDQFLFTDPLVDREREQTWVILENAPPSAYYWKVAALGPSGVEGPFSETRRFRITAEKIRDTGDTEPPALELTDVVQTGAMVIINGRTEPGAQVWVDDEKVDVSDEGAFYTIVRLRREGLNELRFVAQDAAGNRTEMKRVAYVDSF